MTLGAVVWLSVSTLTAHMLPPGDHIRELRLADQIRSYMVHIPRSYDATKSTPVVVVFHSANDERVDDGPVLRPEREG